MCTRAEMRQIVTKIMPEYNSKELDSVVGICMYKVGCGNENQEVLRKKVKEILKNELKGVRGYDLQKNLYCLIT